MNNITPDISRESAEAFAKIVGRKRFNFHASATTGSLYADRSFLPALAQRGYGPETYSRSDFHFKTFPRSSGILPIVTDSPADLHDPDAEIEVWYDNSVKWGDTTVALALYHAEHRELLEGKKVLLVSHEDRLGIADVCDMPLYPATPGHRTFEQFVNDSSRFKPYAEKLAPVFPHMMNAQRNYTGILIRKGLETFMERAQSRNHVHIQLLKSAAGRVLVVYDPESRETITFPGKEAIQEMIFDNHGGGLIWMGLEIFSEQQAIDFQEYFEKDDIPVYGTVPRTEPKFSEKDVDLLLQHIVPYPGEAYFDLLRKTGINKKPSDEFAHADFIKEGAVRHSVRDFLSATMPRMIGFSRQRNGVTVLTPEGAFGERITPGSREHEIQSFYLSLTHKHLSASNGACHTLVPSHPESGTVTKSAMIVLDTREAPTMERLLEIDREVRDSRWTRVRYVLTHRLSENGERTEFAPHIVTLPHELAHRADHLMPFIHWADSIAPQYEWDGE